MNYLLLIFFVGYAFSSDLSNYIEYAQSNNTDIKAFEHKLNALKNNENIVGALPDPMIMYAYFYENVQTKTGPQNHKFSLKQTIPFPGTLGLQEDIAHATTLSTTQKLKQLNNTISFEVKKAYAKFYLLEQKVVYLSKNMALLNQEYEMVKNKYESSLVPYTNLYLISNMMDKLENQLEKVKRNAIVARINLALLCGYEQDTVLPAPVTLVTVDTTFYNKYRSARESYDSTIEKTPLVQSLKLIEQAKKNNVSLQYRNYFPNLTLGVDYIQTDTWSNSEVDPVVFNVSLNLPINISKRSSAVSKAKEELKEAEVRLKDTKDKLNTTISITLQNIENAFNDIVLYHQKLIPRTIKYLEINKSHLISASRDYQDYIKVQKELYEQHITLEEAKTAYFIETATLAYTLGVSK